MRLLHLASWSRTRSVALPGLLLLLPVLAWGQPHPWPFDFDPQDTANPAYVEDKLGVLGEDLPGLPPGQLEMRTVDLADLYFFTDIIDAFERTVGAGPGVEPAWDRTPQTCVVHAGFSAPDLLVASPSLACQGVQRQIDNALEDADETCLEVEFPETYVYKQTPGEVSGEYLSSFEGLISYAGEALTHVEFPAGMLPDDFIPTARRVIAKIRHDTLQTQLGDRLDDYATVQGLLETQASCLESSARQSFAAILATLVAELETARGDLDTLYSDGLAQAAIDRAAVEAQGRIRNDLLHPALSDRERELLAMYIGALYWRMRGAGLTAYPPDPGQGTLRRYLYVHYPYQLIGDLTAGSDSDRVGSTTFIQENWGYADWMDMGRSPGNDKYADLVEMTNRGKRQILMVEPLMSDRGYDTRALVAGGLQMGPCYFYAWDELRDFQLGYDLQDPYMWVVDIPTATGELCMGATLGLGYARSFLWGTPRADCVADCSDRVCGLDGCGGSCGSCEGAQSCELGQCIEPGSDAGADAAIEPGDAATAVDAGSAADAGPAVDATGADGDRETDAAATPDASINPIDANTRAGGDDAGTVTPCHGEACDPEPAAPSGCSCTMAPGRTVAPWALALLTLSCWRRRPRRLDGT